MKSIYGRLSVTIESIWRADYLPARHPAFPGEFLMLDVLYIALGAVFLTGCILYVYACEHL